MYAGDEVVTTLNLSADDLRKLGKLPKNAEMQETIEVLKTRDGDVYRIRVRFKQYKHRETKEIK